MTQTSTIFNRDMNSVYRYFSHLSHHGDRMKFDLGQAATEARSVFDVIVSGIFVDIYYLFTITRN